MASFPGAPRFTYPTFVLNNEAFIIGGTNFSNIVYNQVFKYNSVTDSWLFIGVFPGGPRHATAATSANGKGYFGQGEYTSFSPYITVNDWWEFEVVTGVGIAEKENENLFNLFPNPASTEITLDAGTHALPSLIHIYNIKGQLMTVLKPSSEKLTIDVSNYPPGNYLVQAFLQKKIITQTFVKE
jgi:N-acetylneuraminic acid mutarotase